MILAPRKSKPLGWPPVPGEDVPKLIATQWWRGRISTDDALDALHDSGMTEHEATVYLLFFGPVGREI